MTQHLTERDVRDIATYARIELTDDELVQMTTDLNSIIDTLKPITELDLDGVTPTFHPIGSLSNVMREDAERESFTQEVALRDRTKQQDGSFRIPSIVRRRRRSTMAFSTDTGIARIPRRPARRRLHGSRGGWQESARAREGR